MPQIFTRRSSRNSASLRKTSQPEETIHYSSEKDERIEMTVTDPIRHELPKEKPPETDEDKIKRYFKLFNTIVIYVDVAQSLMDITSTYMNNESGEMKKSLYTRIKLPKIVLKSTFAEYITRSSLRLKVNPPLTNKTTFNWTIQLQDMDINTMQDDEALPVLKPWQTTLTVATTKRKQPVATPADLDYTFKSQSRVNSPKAKPKSKTVANERTSRLSQASSVSSNSLEQIFSDSERSPSPKLTATKHVKTAENPGNNEKFEEIICLNVHLDSSIIHLYGNNMKILQLHCSHLMAVIEMLQKVTATVTTATTKSFASSSSKRQSRSKHVNKPLMILTSTEENQHIKEFMDMDSNSDASALPANESKCCQL